MMEFNKHAFKFEQFSEFQKLREKKYTNFDIINQYFNINNSEKILLESTLNILSKCINKLKIINNYNIVTFSILIKKLHVKYFDIYNLNNNEIDIRIETFFNLQKNNDNGNNINQNINNYIKIINYQYILCKYYVEMIGSLTSNNNTNINISSIKYVDNNNIYEYVNNYIKKIKIYSKELLEKKNIIFDTLEDKEEFNNLKKSIEKIINDLLINNSNIISYGSYTCFNIDNKNIYNDIDIYHTNSYYFLICLMCIIHFITNKYVSIFSIPYITGHLSLKFKNKLLLDCIYIDNYTLSYLHPIKINNKNFINPGLQMLNNIRMSSEIYKLSEIYKKQDITLNKYYTLLNYFLSENNDIIIPEKKMDIKSINYTVYNKLAIIFDFRNLINTQFEKVVVFLQDPENMINYINSKQINGKFSKKFHAFLNEIFFESIKKIENDIDQISTIEVNISQIKKLDDIKETYDIIYDETKYNNCLFMSFFSISLYLQGNKLHELSIQSIFSTFVLYNYLHNLNDKNKYYNVLLQFLTLDISNINNYKLIDRIKRNGNHYELTLNPLNFTSIIFYKDENNEYYDKNYFINNIDYWS